MSKFYYPWIIILKIHGEWRMLKLSKAFLYVMGLEIIKEVSFTNIGWITI
jgi:hypothetical protein